MTLSTSVHKKATVGFVQDVGTLLAGGTWRKSAGMLVRLGCYCASLARRKTMKIKLALVREG